MNLSLGKILISLRVLTKVENAVKVVPALGIAELASAHALDGSIVLRATISVPELRPKSVSVQFLVATDVAKALAEQLPVAVRMAELQKQQRG